MVDPFGVLEVKPPNAWELPEGTMFTCGATRVREAVATDVLATVSTLPTATSRAGRPPLPHAFANTQVFLDYDNVGKPFPYPLVPLP